MPIFEYSYLDGAVGPQLETRTGWETDSFDFRCGLDFDCGALDYRGMYKALGV